MEQQKNHEKQEGLILRTRRLELGISQQELASAVGLQVRQYQRFEYGERLVSRASMKQGLRICAALDLNPYNLVFGSEAVLYSTSLTLMNRSEREGTSTHLPLQAVLQ